MKFKIKKFELQNGLTFSPGAITVIVGANNCGKTRLLKEIDKYFRQSQDFDYKIIRSISSEKGDLDEIVKDIGLTKSTTIDGTNHTFDQPNGYFGRINQTINNEYFETMIKEVRQLGPLESTLFRNIFGPVCAALVQTEDRLIASKLAQVQVAGNGFLDTIYEGGTFLEKKVSGYTLQAFGMNIKLDISIPGMLSIKVGDDFSSIPPDPRDAKSEMKKFQLLEDQGDGFRSFATALLMLLVTKRPVVLVDEPEAFLHPPQAALFGRIIAELIIEPQYIFLATHSADFLRGLISVRSDINILRLTRNTKGTSGHVLQTAEINQIIKSPMLNSTRVLDSLFYQGAVIVEGDSDRAFYEKVARRYFASDEVHYIHAHNKQTIHRLIEPYAKASVKYGVILDFDVLRERVDLRKIIIATTQTKHLERALELQKIIQDAINGESAVDIYKKLSTSLHRTYMIESSLTNIDSVEGDKNQIAESRIFDLKLEMKKQIDETDKWYGVKKFGTDALPIAAIAAYYELESICSSIGIYIVPCGSLESWLVNHGLIYSENKSKWISRALMWLDENNPKNMPVRDFLNGIHKNLFA